jgi:23S rRNA pseudouridine2605 synthase
MNRNTRTDDKPRAENPTASVRIQKAIAAAGVVSRRAAEALMLEGRVTLNGLTVRTLGTKVTPGVDDLRVDGRRVQAPTGHRYLVLNKPRGYVTTRSDPQGRRTVLDLISPIRDVYPVGRLDYDSEGVLLLTNDGELAERLMHPRHELPRVYQARVRGLPDARDLARLSKGLMIAGRRTSPTSAKIVNKAAGANQDQAVVEVTLQEGRTRQVRKMFDAVGHPVVRLRRVRFGPLTCTDLRHGQFRPLIPVEVQRLKRAVGLR